ncbi:MAG: glutamine synthetase type III, partial [Oscillospiraceae bacterium]
TEIELGVDVIPHFSKDTTDRNRTSPFAFTGNKFEFRMLGSSLSIAGPNIVLNTIVADELEYFADKLEKAEDFTATLPELIKDTIQKHTRVLFIGNGYDEAWVVEAEKRGLLNLKSTADALPHFVDAKNLALFAKHKVFSEAEQRSRCELLLENYCKIITIEAETMVEMIRKDIVPASYTYLKRLTETGIATQKLCPGADCGGITEIVEEICALTSSLQAKNAALEKTLAKVKAAEGSEADHAKEFQALVLPAMEDARAVADSIEERIGEKYWPYPTYGELLFNV